ncbi:uncharacterized protein LOC129743388 [Uranotaenia lowii]|uniref:uncharacterized protein LOC129743388 n=1 Tax=Uranotaenia lowii TaxID=190385 RepID=UPI002478AD1D|nr:uncharacterized protein LOC129743388 [Uranotaenia lowii]
MPGCTEWCEMSQKNKMQTNTLLGGIITLILGGFFIGSSIFNRHLRDQHWTKGHSNGIVALVANLFFLSAIVGSLTCAFLIKYLKKIYLARAYLLMMAAACILLVLVPVNIIGITFAEVLSGLAYGMAYLAVIIHGGEVVIPKLRGTTIASINYLIFIGILVHGTISPFILSYSNVEPNRIVGTIGIMLTLLAAMIGQFMSYESPVYLIQQGQDQEAIQILMKLRLESSNTEEIRDAYIDIKLMLQEDSRASGWIFQDGNWRPLLIISLGKVAAVLSFNASINNIRLVMLDEIFLMPTYSASAAMVLLIRGIFGVVFLFTVDKYGRKPQQALLAFAGGSILTAMGITYLVNQKMDKYLEVAIILVYDLVTAAGVTLIPDVQLSEAFCTKKKSASIAFIQTLEAVLQIIILNITFRWDFWDVANFDQFLLCCGVPMMVIACVLFVISPETANLTIRQSRALFARNDELYETFDEDDIGSMRSQ